MIPALPSGHVGGIPVEEAAAVVLIGLPSFRIGVALGRARLRRAARSLRPAPVDDPRPRRPYPRTASLPHGERPTRTDPVRFRAPSQASRRTHVDTQP